MQKSTRIQGFVDVNDQHGDLMVDIGIINMHGLCKILGGGFGWSVEILHHLPWCKNK